jgi:predicted MFS family arabinose efflux permease
MREMPVAEKPATFREVFAVAEFRALFGATMLSLVGDYFARVAVTVLIFSDTGSVLLSAAAFATSYLPWVAGGPVLAALAERYPYRQVMIICDLARMALVALMAFPGLPLPVLLLLLLGSSLLTPPFEAARSAILPQLLTGDHYVLAVSLRTMATQAALVLGYAVGGVITAVSPHGALMVNAATFGVSALLLWHGVRPRPAAKTKAQRESLLKEAGEGLRMVFGHRVMRPIALAVFGMVGILIVPEGLAAAWSAELGGGSRTAGLLLAAMPIGNVIGVVLTRVVGPERRTALIKPFLLGGPLFLLPALAAPPTAVAFLLVVCAGVMNAVIVPLNGLFVSVLPADFRARAFGVMQGGIQITHAVAVLVAGALAELVPVPVAVGLWAAGGLALMTVMVRTWPSHDVIAAERVPVINTEG